MRSFKAITVGVILFAIAANSCTAFTTSTPSFIVASFWKPPSRRGHNNALVESGQTKKLSTSVLKAKDNDKDDTTTQQQQDIRDKLFSVVTTNPTKSIWFSVIMVFCGAALGPFLDSYHSSFGVLEYEVPLKLQLWGSSAAQPALTTAWWVPELFGLAGFIIGWLYIILDNVFVDHNNDTIKQQQQHPSWPKIFVGISYFTLQYWLSGVLSFMGVSRTVILIIMSILAAAGFLVLDNTIAGLITSLATAVGGPLIEVGLLSTLHGHGGYQYLDTGNETGFFPLWIVPVYFLGGPAVGNLARGVWNQLSAAETINKNESSRSSEPCPVCNDTRRVPCPNCDGVGTYVTYGKSVTCTSCRGRGFVICRNCFSNYNEDPNDIEAIRELMSRMPD